MFTPKASVALQLNMQTNEKRSIDRQSILTAETRKAFDEIQAFIAYLEGASLDDITNSFGIKTSTLKYKLKKLKDFGIEGLFDLRDENGSNQDKKITNGIGQRIQELKISDPALSSREIAIKLGEQDNISVSHTIVNEYLNDVNLASYTGSRFWDSVFSP